jgi:hypothetical protein
MMGFKFRETMRGRAQTDDGKPLAFEFTLSARAISIVAYLLGRPLEVTGRISLEGTAEDVPLDGTLEVALPIRRWLRYDLNFKSQDGAVWRFFGGKAVRYRSFLRTMSWLKGSLYRNGEQFGIAELWFDYRDLPRFLLSFRPTW